ncbi:hypothetical protein F4679DRAFT_593043 [Xylaria curta]|nr:hypothetical protein F4679DRAFT_593043 [Xylaria curta]
MKAASISSLLVLSVPTLNLMRKDNDSLPLDIKAVPFMLDFKCNLKLAVEPRAYPLLQILSLNLGSFMLPYLDSWQIRRLPLCPGPEYRSLKPYEPCITAILIAMAQRNGFSTEDLRAIKTQLLFTHRLKEENMYIYTAHISQSLLKRFRRPRKPPTTYACSYKTPYLIKLQYKCIPFEPLDTFNYRHLAAVSITATPVAEDGHIVGRNKRKRQDVLDEPNTKQRRQETTRFPPSIST